MAKITPQPKVVTREQTHRRPLWEFSKGMNTFMRVSKEMDGASNMIQGWCEHAPDFEPMHWHQANWDEIFFCVRGSLKVLVEDRNGKTRELVAAEHETMFLPAGFTYTLLPSGEESVNLWTASPVPANGIRPFKDLGFPGVVELSKEMAALAQDGQS